MAPGLNDARYSRHGSRIVREAIEVLYQGVDFLPRGKAILHDGVGDVFQSDGVQKLDLALRSYRLNKGHIHLLKTAVGQKERQAWSDVRIAAASSHQCAIEFLVSLKRFGFGIGEIAVEVYVLDNDEAAGTHIAIKRRDGAGWVVEMGEQEAGIGNVEDRANVLFHGSYVEQAKLHIANAFCIHFAARDVELRLIDVRADGLAARAYASGQLQGDVATAATNIEALLPVFEAEALKQ